MTVTSLYKLVTSAGREVPLRLLHPATTRPSGSTPATHIRKRGSKIVRTLSDGIIDAGSAAWAWSGTVQGANQADALAQLQELYETIPQASQIVRLRDNAYVPVEGGSVIEPVEVLPFRYDVSFSVWATYLGWLVASTRAIGDGVLGGGELPTGTDVEVF